MEVRVGSPQLLTTMRGSNHRQARAACSPKTLCTPDFSTCHSGTNVFALAQGCHKTELHFSWWRSVVTRHHGWNRSKALRLPRQQVTVQQQLRQEKTDIIQQVRTELNETVNGRIDKLNSINIALRNVTTKAGPSKPYRTSHLTPRNWDGSDEKVENQTLHVRLVCVDASKRGQMKEKRCCQR